jgi:hypothetical protein
MPPLRELQAGFRAALLEGDDHAIGNAIRADGIEATARLAVYRHHVFTTLTAALLSTYPVIARLVDLRFFGYAAHAYIRAHPPAGPCLFEYGASLADFLERFEPCRHLAYLPDVARLEWAMSRALHAADTTPIEPRALLLAAQVRLHPSVTLLSSEWPVDAIWQANQPEAADASVDLAAGGVCLQVWRAEDEVVFRKLTPAAFVFRAALAGGQPLADAASAALGADPAVDLAVLLRETLDEEVLV